MSEYNSLKDMCATLGEPDILLDSSDYKNEDKRMLEDVCLKYAIYFDTLSHGGCIVYGLVNRGWIVNPSLRWPLFELAKILSKTPQIKAPSLLSTSK